MQFLKVFSLCIIIAALLGILMVCLKSRRFVKNLILNGFVGIAVMIAINLIFAGKGIRIPINEYTVPIIVVCGIPGIILFFMLPFIFA